MCEVSRVCRIDEAPLFGLGKGRPGVERRAICNMLLSVRPPFLFFESGIPN